ncbi:hypothetical protein, partial [Komagataeibacter saccharivorans]|uniref:hypothetical protein n=1 Tax=Komagataeibacter saccharivorans TaxID=265959 RepID=UPI0039EA5849
MALTDGLLGFLCAADACLLWCFPFARAATIATIDPGLVAAQRIVRRNGPGRLRSLELAQGLVPLGTPPR